MIKIILLSSLYYIGLSTSVFAYLDPGSTNIILQFLALIFTFIITGWLFVKDFIKKLFNKIFKIKEKKDK
tara:strand:- start:75 stop:284 length:210 start_codon:yes stop_codon:yes gene_type:complete